MTLDEALLREALEHRKAQLDRQHEADRAKADYHHAIRSLHASGGSLREIAEALGVSHQWVHQVVGDEPPPKPKSLGGDLITCDFCGATQKRVAKLIAGPGVYICGECAELANAVLEGLSDGEGRMSRVIEDSAFKCQFCGKRNTKVQGMVQAKEGRICNQCVDLCVDILASEKT